MKTWTLRDGETWCEVLPVEGGDETVRRAVILDGTYGKAGETVAIPEELSWSEASTLKVPGRTVVSPLDLSPVELASEVELGTLLETLSAYSRDAALALAARWHDPGLPEILGEFLAGRETDARDETQSPRTSERAA